MTKRARITHKRLSYQKRAAAPKVRTWLTVVKETSLLNSMLIGILVISGFTYLGIVNSTAADTVRLHQLSTAIDVQQEIHRDLQLDITEVLSLRHVNEMSDRYELVVATDVEYATQGDSSFALNQ